MEKMRQWSVLTAVGVVAVLALGWFLLISPQRSHASDLRSQAATQQSANAKLQAQVSQLEQQKKGLPAQQKLLDQIATKIPADPQLPTLIRQLSSAAQGSNVDLVSLSPGQPAAVASSSTTSTTTSAASSATLAQIPVTLQVTGSYFNIESFFASVEKLKRAMLVTGFSLAPGGASSSGSGSTGQLPDTLTGQITAMVFESPTTTAPAQATPVAPTASAK